MDATAQREAVRLAQTRTAMIINQLDELATDLLGIVGDPDPFARPHTERTISNARHELVSTFYALGCWADSVGGPQG